MVFKPLFPGAKTPDPNNPWKSVLDSNISENKKTSQSSTKKTSPASKNKNSNPSKKDISTDDLNSALKLFNAAAKRQTSLLQLAEDVNTLKTDVLANQKIANDNYISALEDQTESLTQLAVANAAADAAAATAAAIKAKADADAAAAKAANAANTSAANTGGTVVSTGNSGSSSSFINGILTGNPVSSTISTGTSVTASTPNAISSTPSNVSPTTEQAPKLPVKTAPIDAVLVNDDTLPVEILSDLIFENIGGQELISIARNDTVNGQNIIYQPIKNLYNIQQQYNPTNIVYVEGTSDKYFKNFPIKFELKVPVEGTGPNYDHIYIDTLSKSLVIEAVNMQGDEQIEVELLIDGTIYEAEL